MKLPQMSAGRPAAHGLPTPHIAIPGVSPAGCCAKVCLPLVGCHCVAESPLCP